MQQLYSTVYAMHPTLSPNYSGSNSDSGFGLVLYYNMITGKIYSHISAANSSSYFSTLSYAINCAVYALDHNSETHQL